MIIKLIDFSSDILFLDGRKRERDPFPKKTFTPFILRCFPNFKIVFKVGVCIRSES